MLDLLQALNICLTTECLERMGVGDRTEEQSWAREVSGGLGPHQPRQVEGIMWGPRDHFLQTEEMYLTTAHFSKMYSGAIECLS